MLGRSGGEASRCQKNSRRRADDPGCFADLANTRWRGTLTSWPGHVEYH